MIVDADATDAIKAEYLDAILLPYTRSAYPSVARVLRTPFYDEWCGRGDELAQHAEELGPRIVAEVLRGEGHAYVPFAGQSAGLVADVQPAADIVRRVVAEADAILRGLQVDTPSSLRA